jgi:hypothetical protein
MRLSSGEAPAQDLATAPYGAARFASYASELHQATRYAENALARSRALHDLHLIGSVISLIGMMELCAGHHEVALDWDQRGLAEVDSESEPQTYATLLINAAPYPRHSARIRSTRRYRGSPGQRPRMRPCVVKPSVTRRPG